MQTARVDSRKMASEARSLESLSGGGIQIRGRSERLESAESSGPEVFQGRPTTPDGDSPNREPENPARHRRTAFDTAKKAVETKKKPAIVHCTIAGQFVYPTVNRSSSRNLELRATSGFQTCGGFYRLVRTLGRLCGDFLVGIPDRGDRFVRCRSWVG